VQAVLRVAQLHDDLLSAKDPVLTLRLAGGCCALALLSNIFRCRADAAQLASGLATGSRQLTVPIFIYLACW
jgi:hypothetical protein